MGKNAVRLLREKAGLSQRALAQAAGTSQQQIARIETGGQAVKIDLALRIAAALKSELEKVFPETRTLLKRGKKKQTRDELVELHYDPEAVKHFDDAGLDLDPATWTIQLKLRGGTAVGFPIVTAEVRRLRRNLSDIEAWAPFFVFDSSEVTVAINLNHLLFYHELWDSYTPADWHDEEVPNDEVAIWFVDSAKPITLTVEPDEGSPDDENDEGQLRHLFFTVQTMVEPHEFLQIFDADGENAFFRADDVTLITVPRRLINPELDDALYEAECGPEDETPNADDDLTQA